MKVGRRARPFGEMARGVQSIIDPLLLELGPIKGIANRVVVRIRHIPLLELLERFVARRTRHRHRFAKALGQCVGGLEIVFAGIVFRHPEPGITQPLGMALHRLGQIFQISPVRPHIKKGQFLRLAEHVEIRFLL